MLNLEFYSGEETCSDGRLEDELLEIVRKSDDYTEVLKKDSRWQMLYNLSDIRQNLLDWYDFGQASSVLEIGAGCGAITGVLCKNAGSVTSIEPSKKRSMVNAERNRDCSNLEILVGKFEDVKTDRKFDYVVLVDVFAHAPRMFPGEYPFNALLTRVKEFLKPGGSVIIAIENKFGLKYFSGAAEEHTGLLYDGINGYKSADDVRTFTRNELEKLLGESGFEDVEFYYPMPDFRMPTVVYSDDFLPQKGDLRNITNVYDRDRYNFIDEEAVYDRLCEDGMFGYFANSFLVFAKLNRI
jgi:SAM-dependent methyltransferase